MNEDVREALVGLLIEDGAGESLDAEDREILRRYGMKELGREEMMSFFERKAARIEAQRKHPQ